VASDPHGRMTRHHGMPPADPEGRLADLEGRLADLGRRVAVPQVGDVAAAVGRRLHEEQTRPRPWWRILVGRRGGIGRRNPLRPVWTPAWRRALAPIALVGVVVGTILVVPAARDAVAGLLGLGGVEIRQVPELPAVSGPADLRQGLGRPVTLDQARASESFPIALPATLGDPDEVFLSQRYPGGVVTLLWDARPGLPAGSITPAGLVLTEFRGSINSRTMVAKLLDRGATIESVTVLGQPAYWIGGQPHEVVLVDEHGEYVMETLRLEGTVLLWVRNGVTMRIESGLSRDEAIRVAESIR
jgi:hypothetical protein